MDLVLELKNNASKLLLAVMESCDDSENAERILYNMNPRKLVDVGCKAYHQKLVGGEEAASRLVRKKSDMTFTFLPSIFATQ